MTEIKEISIAEQFRKLAFVAPKLNEQSDQLGITMSQLETAIKSLNLGVEAWFPMEDTQVLFGYAKVHNYWGLAFRDGDQFWKFGDAPRAYRLASVKYVEDLLGELVQAATDLLMDVHQGNQDLKGKLNYLMSSMDIPNDGGGVDG